MKRILTCFILLALFIAGEAQNRIPVTSPSPVDGKVQILSSDINHSVVKITLGGVTLQEVATPAGAASVVKAGGMTQIMEKGAPDLPKITASLVIPDLAGMEVKVVSSAYHDIPGVAVAPSRGIILRDTDPASVPYTYGPAYGRDEFYPGALAWMRDPYIIRDIRGQSLVVNPVQYNPVSKTLRIYDEIIVEVFKSSETGINPLNISASTKRVPADYLPVVQRQFLNFDAMSYLPLEEYGNVLVLCHGPFMEAMQPYVDWKRSEGYFIEMIDADSAGTTAAQTKTFVAEYYANKGLTHLLLVGDGPQIPTNTGGSLGGPSDNAYGYIVGNDRYADVFVGRFSAQTVAEVETQVQRTLDYEQSPQFISDDWYTTVIGIASNQGPGDDNELDYQHIRNQQTQLLEYTYTWNPELFDGSQGGNDANGNPTPAMVATEVNAGAGLILYCGHGSQNSWGTSGFSNNNVNQLTNAGMLPFIWSVACVNGNFTNGTCFAEAWLRASQNGEPTGAIAFLGSTINQSWDPPMEGQDEMTDILAESYSTNIKRTFAGLSINGCMKMIDTYGNDGADMADTWTVFGDPTIMVRTSAPSAMAVVHPTSFTVGDTSFAISCDTEGARITLTVADSIMATGLVTDSALTLVFPALTTPFDTVRMVVTAYNKIPYQVELPVEDFILIPVQALFDATPLRVLPGGEVAFADSSTGTVLTWEWSFPGGTPSSSTEQHPVVTYDARGTYDVTLIVGNGLYSDTLVKTEYITCDFPTTTGTTPTANFGVSPNPCDGLFELSLPEKGTYDISVVNIVGATVYTHNGVTVSAASHHSINLRSVPAGLYFVRILHNGSMSSLKLMIR